MDTRTIDGTLSVVPQMQPEDLAALAAQGFAALVCSRPDGEDPGQPSIDAMRDAALQASPGR